MQSLSQMKMTNLNLGPPCNAPITVHITVLSFAAAEH